VRQEYENTGDRLETRLKRLQGLEPGATRAKKDAAVLHPTRNRGRRHQPRPFDSALGKKAADAKSATETETGRGSAVPPRYLVLPAPGSRSLPIACCGSLHFDFYAHPRMDAALKKMFTFRQTRDLALAALKDSGLGHRDVRKAAGTFGNRVLTWRIEYR